jgi:hypothetical protein
VAEESFFGFPAWSTKHFGKIITPRFYFISHIFLVAIVIIASIGPFMFKSASIILPFTVLVVLFVNGLFHLLTTFIFREYSPGVVTSLFIYFPFAIFFWNRCGQSLSLTEIYLGSGLGTAISLLVVASLFLDAL